MSQTESNTATDANADARTQDVEELRAQDQEALAYIRAEDGVTQSALWKELGVSSRTGTRIARRLADAGVITREETVHDGRQTYWLSPSESDQSTTASTGESADSTSLGTEETTGRSTEDADSSGATQTGEEAEAQATGREDATGTATAETGHVVSRDVSDATEEALDEPAAVREAVYEMVAENAPVAVSQVVRRVPSSRPAILDAIDELIEMDAVDVRQEAFYGRTEAVLSLT